MSGMAPKSYVSYVSYVILGGLVAAIGLFLYYRNSSPVQTSAPTTTAPATTAPATTAPTTTAPTTTAPTTTAPTTVAPTLAPYVPWYSPPQLPARLQIVPKSNISCQQCVTNQEELRAKMQVSSAELSDLDRKNLQKQLKELVIELEKRGKTPQEIAEQFELINEKHYKFQDQLNKLTDDLDIRGDICGNMCPTCRNCSSKIDIDRSQRGQYDDKTQTGYDFKTDTYNIRYCMNGEKKAYEACEVFRKTGVTPSPMMTVPPPQ
jgi:predicted Zn-ribbon and HTH transcriptional regulator